jgi:hypothetical protein
MIKCPTCGSTAQVKLKEIYQAERYVQITWVCGCGTEQVTRMSHEAFTTWQAKNFLAKWKEQACDDINVTWKRE